MVDFTKVLEAQNVFYNMHKFNLMYKLPVEDKPTLKNERVTNFLKVVDAEVQEGYDIVTRMDYTEEQYLNTIVSIADWLGDIIIYCMSEMLKYGLDPAKVLNIIMQSNFSKLGADGNPIYDSLGKVEKGPNFIAPEKKLAEYIKGELES